MHRLSLVAKTESRIVNERALVKDKTKYVHIMSRGVRSNALRCSRLDEQIAEYYRLISSSLSVEKKKISTVNSSCLHFTLYLSSLSLMNCIAHNSTVFLLRLPHITYGAWAICFARSRWASSIFNAHMATTPNLHTRNRLLDICRTHSSNQSRSQSQPRGLRVVSLQSWTYM